jgi:hypothetical protein
MRQTAPHLPMLDVRWVTWVTWAEVCGHWPRLATIFSLAHSLLDRIGEQISTMS